MTRQPLIARRAESLLDAAVVATAPLAGGDISAATKLRLSNGRTVVIKTLSNAADGFFAAEAAGLRWLGEVPDGVHVPEVLAVENDCLILEWIESGRNGAEQGADFGRALARTHQAGAPAFGAERDGFIGTLPMPNGSFETWADFYPRRRVLPYLRLARDRGAVSSADATAIEGLLPRWGELVPAEPPARLHGDLWNGNVLWGLEPPGSSGPGRVSVIDPAAYGGHREVDLAMLALFGLPHLPRALEAYQEVAPLADGWEDRLPLHQLFPLLVHACLFGGGYGARAGEVARRFG